MERPTDFFVDALASSPPHCVSLRWRSPASRWTRRRPASRCSTWVRKPKTSRTGAGWTAAVATSTARPASATAISRAAAGALASRRVASRDRPPADLDCFGKW